MTFAVPAAPLSVAAPFPIALEAETRELSHKISSLLSSKRLFTSQKQIAKLLKPLTAHQFKGVMDGIALNLCGKDAPKDPLAALQRLASIVPLEELQGAIRTAYPAHIDALETAKGMFHEAVYYLEKTQTKASPSLLARLSGIADIVISLIDTLIASYGLKTLFKPAEFEWEASAKKYNLEKILALFLAALAALSPTIGASSSALLAGALIAAFCAISLLSVYFQPIPFFLPEAENWTKQFQQGELRVAGGRKSSIDEIAHTLIASKKMKVHPMLIGKSGIGKTQTIQALVQTIEQGDYPELKGKKIFYINTANLVGAGAGGKILSRISEAMGRHREKIILVLDEVHLACQKREGSAIGEQLKTLLDDGNRNFPYVIGITTEEEFYRDIYVNNSAFARRFKRINIENTDESETLEILNNFLLQQAPATLLENNALSALFQKAQAAYSKTAAQPATSLRILSQCIKRTAITQKSTLVSKMDLASSQLRSLYSCGAVGQGSALLPYHSQRQVLIQKLEAEVQLLKAEIAGNNAQAERISQNQALLAFTKTASFRTALKVANFAKGKLSVQNANQRKAFLLLSHFLAPTLDAQIQAQGKALGVKTVIDTHLIDEVIGEEQENDKKSQAAVERGKKQIADRTESKPKA